MSWSERQRAMLREMGLRVWQPSSPSVEPEPVLTAQEPATAQAADAATPAPRPPVARAAAPVAAPVVGPAAVPMARADSTALSALGWPELRETVAQCQACVLCKTRKQTVFGVGHTQARWMIVGEAPGEQEDLQGEPFVGAAGQLLDAMLRALGLTRGSEGPEAPEQRVYIANTLKCRPPRNRNPEPEEMAACEPFLMRQIELLQPRIILAMGRFAIQSLLRSNEAVGRLRGRVHDLRGTPLVVTYHPAYLLRNLPEKARAWEDLCLAAQTFEAAAR